MPTYALNWSVTDESGTLGTHGLTYCNNLPVGYISVPSECNQPGNMTFSATLDVDCVDTISGFSVWIDAAIGSVCSYTSGKFGDTCQGTSNAIVEVFDSTGIKGRYSTSLANNSYGLVSVPSMSVSGPVRIDISVPRMKDNPNTTYVTNYLLVSLPDDITYTSNVSVPSSSTTINATNTLTVGGVTYKYKTGNSLTVSTTASGGCPRTYTYHNIITQDSSTIGTSTNPSATFTLSKCTFGHPYTVTGYVSNSVGDSARTNYNVLIGGAPESIILNNSVIYLAPGTQTKLYVSGKTYANDVTCSISATTGNVVNYNITNKTVDTNSGAFSIEITLTGVFTNPSTYLNISVSDFYGITDAPQCYVEGGVESSFTLSPRYPLVSETVTFTNTSITGTGIAYTWTINTTDPLLENDDWTASYSGNNLIVTFRKGGTYTISLKTQYLQQFEDTYTLEIDVGKTVNASEPSARYKVLIRDKDSYNAVLVGRSVLVPNNGKCVYTNLKFSCRKSESSQATFRLVGANTLIGVDIYSLIRQGSKVFIVDDNVVVWAGIITDISETNTKSPYSAQSGYVKYHDVTCMDAIYELMYSQYEGAVYTVTDTVKNLLTGTSSYYGILPDGSEGILGYEAQGVNELTQTISFPFTNTDRYSLLTQLVSLTGWHYRYRPNVIEAKTPCTVNGNTCTYTSENNVQDGDIIYVDIGDYEDGLYHTGTMFGVFTSDVITSNKTFTFNTGSIKNTLDKTTGYVTVIRMQSLYDVAPSFYQNEYVRRYTIDKDINNVVNSSSVNDKYGIISVTTRSLQGTTITSQMKGFMKINPDYSIPSAYVIVKSADSYIINTDFITRPGTMTISYYDLKGWTTPTDVSEYNNLHPCVYHSPSGYQHDPYVYPIPTSLSSQGAIRGITRYIGADNEKYTRISFNDYLGSDPDDYTWATNMGLEVGKEIITEVYTLNTTDGLTVGDYILLGDEIQRIYSITGNDIRVYRSISLSSLDTKDAHGHMVGTLVFKISSSDGPTSSDIETGSPMDLYGNTIYTSIAANGQTQMEIELIAQNLLRFGSNYMDNGSATIPLIYFGKTDKGMFSPFIVGDHLSIQPAYQYPNAKTEFELIGYDIDTQKYVASVIYGMPVRTMVDILSGVSTNQMVTISNADYQ